MKTFHALVLAGALVGTGLALAVGIVRSDAIAPSFFGSKAETTIAQPTSRQSQLLNLNLQLLRLAPFRLLLQRLVLRRSR
jgi:hypothetical protein